MCIALVDRSICVAYCVVVERLELVVLCREFAHGKHQYDDGYNSAQHTIMFVWLAQWLCCGDKLFLLSLRHLALVYIDKLSLLVYEHDYETVVAVAQSPST